jgi:hypothetical protein
VEFDGIKAQFKPNHHECTNEKGLDLLERLNNPGFNFGEFALIKSLAGPNCFALASKQPEGRGQ